MTSYFPPAIGGLAALTELPEGWNYGKGHPASELAYLNSLAISLMTAMMGATKFEYFPEDDGGILTIAYRDDGSVEILAKSDGGFEIVFDDNNGLSPAKECTTFDELRAELEQNGWQSPKSSDSFTRVITAPEKSVTRRWRFDPATAGFQSSIPNASTKRGIPVVPMRRFTTLGGSGVHRQYFGESQRQNLLVEAS